MIMLADSGTCNRWYVSKENLAACTVRRRDAYVPNPLRCLRYYLEQQDRLTLRNHGQGELTHGIRGEKQMGRTNVRGSECVSIRRVALEPQKGFQQQSTYGRVDV